MSYYYHTNNKDAVYAYAHYTDKHFDGEGAVIFGKNKKGLQFEYSDRLVEWDRKKSDAAWAVATERYGMSRTARKTEAYLSAYFDRAVDLQCIIAGTRPFDGYSWYAYGFVFTDQ